MCQKTLQIDAAGRCVPDLSGERGGLVVRNLQVVITESECLSGMAGVRGIFTVSSSTATVYLRL